MTTVRYDRQNDGSGRLFIDGDLQFCTRDESIYHEYLALPALAVSAARKNSSVAALITGGGDGLTARELLKSAEVASVDLVDYSKTVLDLARNDFADINERSLSNPKLTIHNCNAWNFVIEKIDVGAQYDLIVSDLTVAHDSAGARFHSIEWYRLLARLLTPKGILAVNSLSPSATPEAYWCIINSIASTGLSPRPYRIILPSFREMGYGFDWGFVLASQTEVEACEIKEARLAEPRRALKDCETLARSFLFPAEILDFQKQAHPAHDGSNVLIHYMNNCRQLTFPAHDTFDSLSLDFSSLEIPRAETTDTVLPPELRDALARTGLASQGDSNMLARLLGVMPPMVRHQTTSMVQDFLRNPQSFLDSIDLEELVDELLLRAKELPQSIAEELEHLKEYLSNWSGDYQSLFQLSSRVVTVITLVVVVGNLMYPDAAYGKGDHGGGGGGHGDHGGGGRGDHGDHGGRGDHGDRGDRGGRGDRGFHGDHFDHHFDHWGHWGNYGRWGYGHWGGWARPWHNWSWGGWGGWGVPYYGGGGGFVNFNFNSTNNSNENSIDSQGQTYPARNYTYTNNTNNYTWPGQSDYQNNAQVATGNNNQGGNNTPGGGDDDDSDDSPQKDNADYRLGPDTDILAGGKVVVELTDKAYLLLGKNGTQVIGQDSGKPIMTLANDPSLVWHVQSEIKRQTLGLSSSIQHKAASNDWQGQAGFPSQNQDDANESASMQAAVNLLNQAAASIPDAPDAPPQQSPPPEPGAFEVFAGVYMTADGKYVIVERPDGSLSYMTKDGWYSDKGTTRLKEPYPSQFRTIVVAYVQNLVKEAESTKQSLLQDQQEGQNRLAMLGQRVQQLQGGAPGGDDGGPQGQSGQPFSGGSGGGPGATVNLGDAGGEVPPQEALRRARQAMRRTQRRLDGISKELAAIPQEITAATSLLSNFQS